MENQVEESKIRFNVLIVFVLFYIIGVVAFLTKTVLYFSVILFALVLFYLFKNILTVKRAVIFYSVFAFAIFNCHLKIKNYDDLSQYLPTDAVLTGTVETIPTTNNTQKTKFYLKVDSGIFKDIAVDNINAKTIVTIYDTQANYSNIKIADRVEVKGKLRNPMVSKNPSQFDYSKYLKHHATFSTFYVNAGDWKIIGEPKSLSGKFLQKLNDKRMDILQHQSKYMYPNNLEVLGGIVFGDDAINPPDNIKNSFINSGLLHILAASGMNVSIIFGIWYFIGIRLRLNFRLNIIIGALLVVFYTLMTGMGPSVLRAALMIEFVLLGKLIDRQADNIALVFFVAFLMLLYSPSMICDVGFQLSFVVTFALMYFCPPVLEKIKNKFVNFIAGAMFIPFVAQLWASPIQMFYFNTYSTYSILANFVIVPFIMVISFLGFVSSILAMVPVYSFADIVCKSSAMVLNPVVSVLINISDFFAGLPYSLITTIHPNIFQIVVYYLILFCFGMILKNKKMTKKIFTVLGVLLLVFAISFIKLPQRNCEIIVFDVGNADSFLIKTPNKKYIMIDTAHGLLEGSNIAYSQADAIMNRYMKDRGIKRLNLLLLTHFDSDHSGGAVDVLKSVQVDKLILNKNNDYSKTSTALINFVNEKKINSEYAQNNQTVFNNNGLFLKTFVPDVISSNNDNDSSIVALLSYGDFDMLFMADGGVLSFDSIEKDLNKTDIEVLKSGHHGAKNTLNKMMLESIRPDAVVLSTGLNTYGHPHKETLKTVKDFGAKIFRTDLDNAIRIVATKHSYVLYKYDTDKRRFIKMYKTLNR